MNLALGRDFAVIFRSLCRGPAEALHLCQTLHFLDQLAPRLDDAGSPCVRGIGASPSLLKCDTTWLPSTVLSRPSVEHRSPVMRAEIRPLLSGSPDCNPEKAPQPTRSQQAGDCCCAPVAALGFMCSRASHEKCGRACWAEDSAFSSARWTQMFSFPASVCYLWG